MQDTSPPSDFLQLSARLGRDPLQVQGPGGNTSFKSQGVMWIKASGTELADAETRPIFVAVDRAAALAEAMGAGDGTCKATVIDKSITLRPSIETTFHALLDWTVVVHTHSVATIAHCIGAEGRAVAARKLAGLPHCFVPYRKPGLPLTSAIAQVLLSDTQVIILENHGLLCAGGSVSEVASLIDAVEARLGLDALQQGSEPVCTPPDGFAWAPGCHALAQDLRLLALAQDGSYYPDHVVFLGRAMPTQLPEPTRPAIIVPRIGVAIRIGATSAQKAMVRCLADVLTRVPPEWSIEPIGLQAEAELLDWDAEKYRQALAARQA